MRSISQSAAGTEPSPLNRHWVRVLRFPAAIYRHLRSPWRVCALRITGNDAILVGPRKQDSAVSFDLSEGASGSEDQRRKLTRRWLNRSTVCSLQLKASELLVRELNVPASAKARLEDILDLNLQRVIPSNVADFTYGYCIAGRDGAQLKVKQLVLRKDRLEQIFEFATQLRFPIDRIELVGTGNTQASDLNLRDSPPLRRRRSLWSVNAVLICALLAMILTLMQLNLQHQREALAAISQQTAAQLASAVALKQEIAELQQQVARQTALAALWVNAGSNVALLDEVTRKLPDTAWLTEYRVGADALQLTGFAKSASEVLAALEASGRFKDVKFTAPIQVDPLQKGERFVLVAQVVP